MTGGQDWAAEYITTSGGKGMGKIVRYHPAKTCYSEMHTRPDGYWVRYIDHVAECDRLRDEVEELRKDRDEWRARYAKAVEEREEADEGKETVEMICHAFYQLAEFGRRIDAKLRKAGVEDGSPCGQEVEGE